MTPWQELVKQALIGNISSKKITPILKDFMQQWNIHLKEDPTAEKNLLKVAALHSQLHAVGQFTSTTTEDNYPPAPEETQDYCHTSRQQHLQYIIQYKYDDILIELLDLVYKNKCILRPESLPLVLDYGKNHPLLYDKIRTCIGKRGIWLAQFNPMWHYAIPQNNNQDIFFYGNREERLAYFKTLHKQAPEDAIELLEEVWDSEDFSMRRDFVESIGKHLAASDEPFLETALEDSRREVRKPAAQLLALIEDSRLVKRMENLLGKLIKFNNKKNAFYIELPSSCTTHMQRDGILPRKIFVKDHGPKANQLAQIVSKVPPTWWSATFDKNPQELLHLANQTEWRDILVWGWAMAAKNFDDRAWMLACHQFYLDNFFKYDWSNLSLDFLYQNLPNQLFNQFAHEYLKGDAPVILQGNHPILSFLLMEGQAWDDKLAKKAIQSIQTTINQDSFVLHWELKAVLKRAAFAVSPKLYKVFQEGWPVNSYVWHAWHKEVDRMLSVIKFRLEMITTED